MAQSIMAAKQMMSEGKNFKPIFGVEAYFIDSVSKWKEEYEAHKLEKKVKESDEESGTVVENEEETKTTEKNILNRSAPWCPPWPPTPSGTRKATSRSPPARTPHRNWWSAPTGRSSPPTRVTAGSSGIGTPHRRRPAGTDPRPSRDRKSVV